MAAKKRKTPEQTNPLYKGMAKCKCVEQINKKLVDYNTHIVTTLFTGKVALMVEKADLKMRVKPKTMLATYCPFCGKKYPDGD